MREVEYYQRSADLLLSKKAFRRTVREIAGDLTGPGQVVPRFQGEALNILQEVSENEIVDMLTGKCPYTCFLALC